jgi:acetyl-CoA carboxylase carboxyl transferase subunit alpha
MKLAEKYGIPVLCLVDTPGAYRGALAEARGQMSAIGLTLREMSRLRVPIITAIIGQGGSLGDLTLSVGDHVAIMQYAYLSALPAKQGEDSFARDRETTPFCLTSAVLTAADAVKIGLADELIREPAGGAHHYPSLASRRLRRCVLRAAKTLIRYTSDELAGRRYARLRGASRSAVVPKGVAACSLSMSAISDRSGQRYAACVQETALAGHVSNRPS